MVTDSELQEQAVLARLSSAVPNALSLGRLVLGAAFPWTPPGWRAGVVLAAALSDLLDGFASRRLHAESSTGRVLDPVADKVFVGGVVATFLLEGLLGWLQAALLGLRDLTVLAGAGWVLLRGDWSDFARMRPSLLGKATTAAQFVFLLALPLRPQQAYFLFPPALVLSGLAAGGYLWAFLSRSPWRPARAVGRGAGPYRPAGNQGSREAANR
jgi:phosphatidylglycerophosphate synthase